MISVPDMDKEDQAKFYYQGVVKLNHKVVDIEDERALLPARGIESHDSLIRQKAEEITAGINNQRDQAKAIYKFVAEDRKSTRLNSSHVAISYAVFCLKKKNKIIR